MNHIDLTYIFGKSLSSKYLTQLFIALISPVEAPMPPNQGGISGDFTGAFLTVMVSFFWT